VFPSRAHASVAPQFSDRLRALASRRWHSPRAARLLVAATVAGSTLLTAAVPATMAYGTPLSCTGRANVQYFKPWADLNNYFRISNGGFESGSTDWQFNGAASVVTGNESFHVAGAGDAKALRLTPGGSAESHTLCVSMGEDTVRFFAYNPKVMGAILHVDIVVRNPVTGLYGYFAWDLNADAWPAGWQPVPTLLIPNVFLGSATQELTITLSTRGSAATWLVDDVSVDPFKSY
jgi:hypothetical protein